MCLSTLCVFQQISWTADLCGRLFTNRQRSSGKVMFLQVSVILFRGVPCDHYPWYIGPHCTGNPPGPYPMYRAPASDIWWESLKTYSNLYTSGPPSANIWWLLKHVWLMKAGGTHPTGMLSCMTWRFFTRGGSQMSCTECQSDINHCHTQLDGITW